MDEPEKPRLTWFPPIEPSTVCSCAAMTESKPMLRPEMRRKSSMKTFQREPNWLARLMRRFRSVDHPCRTVAKSAHMICASTSQTCVSRICFIDSMRMAMFCCTIWTSTTEHCRTWTCCTWMTSTDCWTTVMCCSWLKRPSKLPTPKKLSKVLRDETPPQLLNANGGIALFVSEMTCGDVSKACSWLQMEGSELISVRLDFSAAIGHEDVTAYD